VMIATAMGAWGSLLKKHGVLKVYFYSVLLLDIVLLVVGTLCYVRADEISDYVDYKFLTVKDAMPSSQCSGLDTTNVSAAGQVAIQQCKNNMQSTLEDNLRYMGVCCVIVAGMMVCGLVAAGRLLTWDRLTGPLLHGGGIVMILFAIFNITMAADIIANQESALVKDAWSTYVAVGAAVAIVVLAIMGIVGMSRKNTCLLLVYQVWGFFCLILLGYLTGMAFAQEATLTDWTRDNFDTDNNVRKNIDQCYCNNDDFAVGCGVAPNIICNERDANDDLKYYNCVGSTCTRKFDANAATPDAVELYCLETYECINKAADVSQANLVAIAVMSMFYLIYLIVCLAASSNVRAKMLEEQRQDGGFASSFSGASTELKATQV